MRQVVLGAVLFMLVPAILPAQGPQVRIIIHPMFELSEHWYLTAWNVSNVRQKSPDNTNVFAGVGYRETSWWLEGMVQRQWNRNGSNTMLDVRFQKQFANKLSVYFEPAVFLNKKAFYEFVIVERQLWRGLNLGGETENIHRPRADVWVVGPRVSFPIATVGQWSLNGAAAFRFRHDGPDEPRGYIAFSRRFGQ